MKILSKIMALCLIVALVIVVSGFTADDNNAAFIDKDFACGLMDGNGNFHLVTDGTISIVTSSANTTLVCKAKGLPNDQGMAVVTSGFPCGTFLGGTTDSQNTVSASGNVTLRCQVKHD
jgi:hypothetical protein